MSITFHVSEKRPIFDVTLKCFTNRVFTQNRRLLPVGQIGTMQQKCKFSVVPSARLPQ